MKNVLGLISVAVLAVGCASAPSISDLNQGVGKVVLVRNGLVPLGYSTGVIDTSSFWAAYGGGVSDQLGGGTVWQGLQSSGQTTVASKADQNREMVKKLFGAHDLAETVGTAMLPRLANSWHVPYEADRVVTLTDKPAWLDPKTGELHGLETDADLVLMSEVANVNLTERFSVGGAFKAGFTMGTNTKSLTTEVRVAFRALKRNPAGKGYKQVWMQLCGPDYTTMKTSYPLEELAQSAAKMQEILDEAEFQALELCTKALTAVASKQAVVRN